MHYFKSQKESNQLKNSCGYIDLKKVVKVERMQDTNQRRSSFRKSLNLGNYRFDASNFTNSSSQPQPSGAGSGNYYFHIVTEDRDYILLSNNDSEVSRWIENLRKFIRSLDPSLRYSTSDRNSFLISVDEFKSKSPPTSSTLKNSTGLRTPHIFENPKNMSENPPIVSESAPLPSSPHSESTSPFPNVKTVENHQRKEESKLESSRTASAAPKVPAIPLSDLRAASTAPVAPTAEVKTQWRKSQRPGSVILKSEENTGQDSPSRNDDDLLENKNKFLLEHRGGDHLDYSSLLSLSSKFLLLFVFSFSFSLFRFSPFFFFLFFGLFPSLALRELQIACYCSFPRGIHGCGPSTG